MLRVLTTAAAPLLTAHWPRRQSRAEPGLRLPPTPSLASAPVAMPLALTHTSRGYPHYSMTPHSAGGPQGPGVGVDSPGERRGGGGCTRLLCARPWHCTHHFIKLASSPHAQGKGGGAECLLHCTPCHYPHMLCTSEHRLLLKEQTAYNQPSLHWGAAALSLQVAPVWGQRASE